MANAPASPPTKESPQIRSDNARPQFVKKDLPFIRNALIVWALTLTTSATLVTLSTIGQDQWQTEKTQAAATSSALRDQYLQLQNEKREIQEYQARFTKLQNGHLIGEERRLDWIERIRQIYDQRKLPPLIYEVAPQQVFILDPSIPVGDFELRGTKVTLHMGLLHELDLFNFLEDLNSAGIYSTQSCAIHASDKAQTNALSPKFDAECTLYWITLGKPASLEQLTEANTP
jgi:hypothetical protein